MDVCYHLLAKLWNNTVRHNWGEELLLSHFFWLTRTSLTSHLTSSVTPDQPSRTFPRLCYFTLWICDILNAQTTTTTTNVGCFLPCFLTASCRHRTVVDRCGSRSGKSTAGARRWAGESRLISRLERAVPRAAVVWCSEPPKVHSGVTHLHSVTQSTAWPRSFFPSSFFFFLRLLFIAPVFAYGARTSSARWLWSTIFASKKLKWLTNEMCCTRDPLFLPGSAEGIYKILELINKIKNKMNKIK